MNSLHQISGRLFCCFVLSICPCLLSAQRYERIESFPNTVRETRIETQRVWIPDGLDANGVWQPGRWELVEVEVEVEVPRPLDSRNSADWRTRDSLETDGYRFSKPDWYMEWERNGLLAPSNRPAHFDRIVMNRDPQFRGTRLEQLAREIDNRDVRDLELKQIHLQSWQKPAPNEYRLPRERVVMEFEDRQSGDSHFLDVSFLALPNGFQWELKELQSERRGRRGRDFQDAGRRDKPPQLAYQRPAWVVTKPVPGGVILQDTNDPLIVELANAAAVAMTGSNADFRLDRILHAGRQSLQFPKTYLVLTSSDGTVWQVIIESTLNRATIEWSQL